MLRDERLFHDYIEELSGSAKKNSRNPTLIRPYDLHVELEILELLKNQFKEKMESFRTSTEKNRALLNEVTDVFQRKVILMRMQLKLVIFLVYSKPIVQYYYDTKFMINFLSKTPRQREKLLATKSDDIRIDKYGKYIELLRPIMDS